VIVYAILRSSNPAIRLKNSSIGPSLLALSTKEPLSVSTKITPVLPCDDISNDWIRTI